MDVPWRILGHHSLSDLLSSGVVCFRRLIPMLGPQSPFDSSGPLDSFVEASIPRSPLSDVGV